MAQSFLVFDFGTNEEGAQQARHKIEAWQQGSRLGKKLLLKFDREESAAAPESELAPPADEAAAKGRPGKGKSAPAANDSAGGAGAAAANSRVRILVRLDFSDHEKLVQQRWHDRIAAEEPFKSAKGGVVRHSDGAFAKTSELFESLD